MADKLSFPNLLSLIQADQDSDTVGKLCEEAERMRRRWSYSQAIQLAQSAVAAARRVVPSRGTAMPRPPGTLSHEGKALLYLSLARLSLSSPDSIEQATEDCERALVTFSLDLHNTVLARVFRAQIERQIEAHSDDPDEKVRRLWGALNHLEEAASVLKQLINRWRARGNSRQVQAQFYEDLHRDVRRLIEQLVERVALVTPVVGAAMPASATPTPSAAPPKPGRTEPPIKLPLPTELVWPLSDPNKPLDLPLNTPFIINHRPISVWSTTGYVNIPLFSIRGRLYRLRSIGLGTAGGALPQLRIGQQYMAAQVEGNGDKLVNADEYVVVRLQSTAPQPGEKFVIDDKPYSGARHWIIKDGTELGLYTHEEIKIIGIADGVLTPNV